MSKSDRLQLSGLTHRLVIGKRADLAGLPRHLVMDERGTLAAALRPFTAPGSAELSRLRQLYRKVAFAGPAAEGRDFAGSLADALLARGYCAVRFRKEEGGPVLPVVPARDIAPVDVTSFHTAKAEDKYARVLALTLPHLPGEMRGAFAELVSPATLGTTVAILVLWAGSHAIGIGFAIDVLLLAIGFAIAGWSIFGAVRELLAFFEIMERARGEADLERAARKLAAAIAALGVGTFIAILTRGAGRIAAAKRASVPGRSSGGASASDAQIAKYRPKTEEAIRRRKKAADDETPAATSPRGTIAPTGKIGGKPTGRRTRINPDDDAATTRSLQRENEAADALADAGYKVEQNPSVPGNKDPDYLIEGEVFDCKAPSTSRARNAASEIEKSVSQGQADRIVLNLEDSDISLNDMKKQLDDWPIDGLKEVIAIKDGKVLPFWP